MHAKGLCAATLWQIGKNHLVGWVFVLAFLLNVSPLWSQSLEHLFSHRFGNTDHDRGIAIAVDGARNVLVTGFFRGTVDFGGGALTSAGWDIFVAKYDAAGAHLWSQRFGDTDLDGGGAIAVDGAGDVLVTGRFRGRVDFGGGPLTSAGSRDIFVAKFATVDPKPNFRRGDCNDDGNLNISDAVCTLEWLFLGGATPGCVAATNTNGDDAADITDATYLLNHLFAGGPAPAQPFPDCGPGMLPADEELGCANPPDCQ